MFLGVVIPFAVCNRHTVSYIRYMSCFCVWSYCLLCAIRMPFSTTCDVHIASVCAACDRHTVRYYLWYVYRFCVWYADSLLCLVCVLFLCVVCRLFAAFGSSVYRVQYAYCLQNVVCMLVHRVSFWCLQNFIMKWDRSQQMRHTVDEAFNHPVTLNSVHDMFR